MKATLDLVVSDDGTLLIPDELITLRKWQPGAKITVLSAVLGLIVNDPDSQEELLRRGRDGENPFNVPRQAAP